MPTSTWTQNGSASWRTTYGWRSDNNYVYQGEWGGYGVHRGFWFFNDANIRSVLSGQRITRVRIYCSRRSSGGVSGSQSVNFYAHNHASQPSGTPAVGTSAGSAGFAWGTAQWVTLPNWVGERLRDNTAKGIGIYHGSTYAIMNAAATLEIVYEPLLVAPATPTNFRITSTTASVVNLAWNAVSGTVNNYRIDREGGGTATTTNTSWANEGLASNTSDRWRVRAENAAGSSNYSGWITGTTNPATPTGLNVTGVTSGSVSLAWNAVPGNALQHYRFERRVGTGAVDATWLWTPRTSGTNVSPVSPNTSYQYRIRAENAGGVSGYSGWVVGLTLPAVPTNLKAVPSHSSVALTWSGSGTFRVRRGTTVIASGISGTSYTDTNLLARNDYSYSVEAYNASGNSGYTANVNTKTTSEKAIRIHTMPPSEPVLVYPDGVEYALNADIETAFRITDNLAISGTEAQKNANLPYVAGLRGALVSGGMNGAGIIVKMSADSQNTQKRFFLTGLEGGDDIPLNSNQNIILNQWYRVKLRLVGRQIYGKVWPLGSVEPDWESAITEVREPGYAWIGCSGAVGGVTTSSRYEWDSFSLSNLTGTFNIDLLGDLFIGGPTFDEAQFRVAADGEFSIGGTSAENALFKVNAQGDIPSPLILSRSVDHPTGHSIHLTSDGEALSQWIGWYKNGQMTSGSINRRAYFGYGSSNNNHMTWRNEAGGGINIDASPGEAVVINAANIHLNATSSVQAPAGIAGVWRLVDEGTFSGSVNIPIPLMRGPEIKIVIRGNLTGVGWLCCRLNGMTAANYDSSFASFQGNGGIDSADGGGTRWRIGRWSTVTSIAELRLFTGNWSSQAVSTWRMHCDTGRHSSSASAMYRSVAAGRWSGSNFALNTVNILGLDDSDGGSTPLSTSSWSLYGITY